MAKAKEEKHEVATRPPAAVATRTELPEHLRSFDNNLGNEDVRQQDLTIPRLVILQKLNPQLDKTSDKFVLGAEEGDLFNTLTGDVYKEGVRFVDCYARPEWACVIPNSKPGGGNGKGFKGIFTALEEAIQKCQTIEHSEVVDMFVHYGLLVDEEWNLIGEIVIPMKSSMLKVSKLLNSRIRAAGGPRFSRAWKLTTVAEKNDKGNFYNLKVEGTEGFVVPFIVASGHKLYMDVKGGVKQMETETETEGDRPIKVVPSNEEIDREDGF